MVLWQQFSNSMAYTNLSGTLSIQAIEGIAARARWKSEELWEDMMF